jgi:hypothetical protein
MEVSTSILVALMFVTLLSMGIGNIINTLSSVIEKGKESGYTFIQVGWFVLLLMTSFNMFWHTLELLAKDDWKFIAFLYMMVGPIILYFASSILISSKDTQRKSEVESGIRSHFLIAVFLLQVWIITVDIILGDNEVQFNIFNIILSVILIVLINTSKIAIQRYGIIISLALVFIAIILRGFNIID